MNAAAQGYHINTNQLQPQWQVQDQEQQQPLISAKKVVAKSVRSS